MSLFIHLPLLHWQCYFRLPNNDNTGQVGRTQFGSPELINFRSVDSAFFKVMVMRTHLSYLASMAPSVVAAVVAAAAAAVAFLYILF